MNILWKILQSSPHPALFRAETNLFLKLALVHHSVWYWAVWIAVSCEKLEATNGPQYQCRSGIETTIAVCILVLADFMQIVCLSASHGLTTLRLQQCYREWYNLLINAKPDFSFEQILPHTPNIKNP